MKWKTAGLGLLAAIAAISLVFGFGQYRQAQAARIQLEGMRQRAIFSLISHVENIEADLAKARAASTTGQRTAFLTACWSHSESARDSLGQISVPGADLTSMRQYIARVGDYSRVLAQKLSRGGTVTPKEWSDLEALENGIKDLSKALSETGKKALSTSSPKTLRGVAAVMGFAWAAPKESPLLEGFSEMDTMSQSIPSPVYDGPFAERNQALLALARPGPAVSLEEAKKRAIGFMNPEDRFESVRVENVDGAIPGFLVTGKRPDGSEVTVSVALQGGAVVWATDSRVGRMPAIDIDTARKKSLDFLKSKGFETLVETGWRKPGPGAGRVTFAYVPVTTIAEGNSRREVKLYPDTVKVEVALDTGQVLSFDQRAYLTTNDHPSRAIPAPLVTLEEARNVLKDDLKVLEGGGNLAVVPLLPTREILAWEFLAQHGSDMYLIYINAMTGAEEMIFKVISDDTGSLTT